MTENTIYHITSENYFKQFSESKPYISPTFKDEKFIHLSCKDQVNNTLQKYYLETQNLVLLHVDLAKLEENLKYEKASNGELFPHCYAPIPFLAILKTEKLNRPQLGIPTWNS